MFYTERQICSRLEKELCDIKTEHEEDKKKWEKKEQGRKTEIIQLKNEKDALQESYNEQLKEIEELETRINLISTTKTKAEENLEEQIEILKAETEKLMKLKKDQTDLEELRRLRAENNKLSTQMENLRERAENVELVCKRLEKEREKNINFRRRKYKGTKLIGSRYPLTLLICVFLTRMFSHVLSFTR